MEKIAEFFEEIKLEPVTYVAVFDVQTGEVKSVGPSTAFLDHKNTISIDSDIAELIIEGQINIFNCAVDIRNLTFELLEKKTVLKIDDILHRIVDIKWNDIDNPDIFVICNKDEKTLTIELTEEFGGTYILPEKYQPIIKRKVIWDGETKLDFYITDYNDPNVLFFGRQVLLRELIDSKIVFKDINFPKHFSVYTRRVLKNYAMKIE